MKPDRRLPAGLAVLACIGALFAVAELATLTRSFPGRACPFWARQTGDCFPRIPPLRATLYYTALEGDYRDSRSVPFRADDGDVLKSGSRAFRKAAAIEGSALFSDGELLNYHTLVDGQVRWMKADTAFGLDARGCELTPFRSAAVDPDVLALGTSIRIPETVGMPLPDGGRHDGIWIAADTGSSIKGNRIDLYLGRGRASMAVTRAYGIGHMQPLTIIPLAMEQDCTADPALTPAERS